MLLNKLKEIINIINDEIEYKRNMITSIMNCRNKYFNSMVFCDIINDFAEANTLKKKILSLIDKYSYEINYLQLDNDISDKYIYLRLNDDNKLKEILMNKYKLNL